MANNEDSKDDSYWLNLYNIYKNEEQFDFKSYLSSIAFYSGLITSVIALTVGGIIKTPSHEVLLLGPLIIIGLSIIGLWSTSDLYKNVLIKITTLAKIEEELGLTNNRNEKGEWWVREPIIYYKYIKARQKHNYNSAKEFVKAKQYHGYNRKILLVFSGFIIIGMILGYILINS